MNYICFKLLIMRQVAGVGLVVLDVTISLGYEIGYLFVLLMELMLYWYGLNYLPPN